MGDLRMDFTKQLMKSFDDEMVSKILNVYDSVACNYNITKATTEVVLYTSKYPVELEEYIINCHVKCLSELSIKGYSLNLKNFFDKMQKTLGNITAMDIRAYLYWYQNQRTDKVISNRSMDKIRQIIYCFFEWCVKNERLPKNPAAVVDKIKYVPKQREALTTMELEMVRSVCTTPRDKAMLEFFFSTGCRVSELVNVKINEVDFENKRVRLFGKGSKERFTPISDRCVLALKDYMATRTDADSHLFVTLIKPYKAITKDGVEDIVAKWELKSGITKHLTPHILRHTFATLGLKNGMKVTSIQKCLGHSSVATTMIYAEVSQDDIKAEYSKAIM